MTHTFTFSDRVHVQFEIRFYVHFLMEPDTPRPIRYWRWCNWQRYTVHQTSFITVTTLLHFGFTKPTPATLNKQIEAEPDLNNNQIYYWGIHCCSWGIDVRRFLELPLPPNLRVLKFYLIIHISKHRFYHFKQSSCTPVIHDGNTPNTVIFSDQAVKTGIIYFELFNYLNQHQSK